MTHDCEQHEQYNEEHDAFYCSECDKWLEKDCGDPTCGYCPGRPEHPSEV